MSEGRREPPVSSGLPASPASPAERDRVAAALCRHFARDHLEVADLERRLDLTFAARTAAQLEELLSDLPELPPEEVGAPEPAPSGPPGPVVEAGLEMEERGLLVGIMGGAERAGAWTPPRQMYVFALMGGAGLDFREARLGASEIHVTVVAIMGGVEIVVPPGVRVEARGSALMGAFEHDAPGPPPGPKAPVLRIDGFALMGGVEITVRLPGESEREARRRRKTERRRLKAEGMGPRRLPGG